MALRARKRRHHKKVRYGQATQGKLASRPGRWRFLLRVKRKCTTRKELRAFRNRKRTRKATDIPGAFGHSGTTRPKRSADKAQEDSPEDDMEHQCYTAPTLASAADRP